VLSDDRQLWRGCTTLFGLFAILKGIHRPYPWGLTQAQIDYSQGFVKRGLQGAVLNALHIHRYESLAVLFWLQYVAFLSAAIALGVSSRLERKQGCAAIFAVLSGSYVLTYLTSIVGYTDLLLGTIAVCLLLLRSSGLRFAVSLFAVPTAMLIHENFLFLFFPVLLFSFVLDFWADSQHRALGYGVALSGIALALAALMSVHPALNLVQVQQLQEHIKGQVDFSLQPEVFDVFSRSLRDNMAVTARASHDPAWRRQLVISFLALCPLLVMLLYFNRKLLHSMRRHGQTSAPIWVIAAAMSASLAPLLMYLLGWDCARWNVLTTLSAALIFLLLGRFAPETGVPLSTREIGVAVVLMAFGMLTGGGFFGSFQGNKFPFF